MKEIFSKWEPEKRLFTIRLGGEVDLEDIAYWKKTIYDTASKIPPQTKFKAFINLFNFKAIDLTAHKTMRNVIPTFLASNNFKAGYLDLFENADYNLALTDGKQCVAAVHVHNNVEKITLFREKFGQENEQFFNDPIEGQRWIESFRIK